MSRKEEYKEKNLLYLDEIASEEGIRTLPCGILYKVIQAGTGKVSPNRESVVSVHYKGTLINGREFDIYIPYNFGYGNRASGPIPAFSTLIFEVELLGIA